MGIRNPGHTGTQHLVTRSGRTNSRGQFTVGGLSTGDYLLRVVPGGRCRNGIAYFAGLDTLALPASSSAASVAVQLGEDTTVGDMQINVGSSLSGRISNARRDTRVVVRDAATGEVVASKSVRGRYRNNYSFRSLLPGSYRVSFNRVSGQSLSTAQFYSGVPEQDGRGASDVVVVEEGEPTGGVDATLVAGGSLTGQLVDEAGDPLRCNLQAVDPRTALFSNPGNTGLQHLVTRTATSRKDGSFSIRGLTDGECVVRVVPGRQCRNGFGYSTGDQTITDRDPAMAAPAQAQVRKSVAVGTMVYPSGGGITGQIDLPDGGYGSDMRVIVRDADGNLVGSDRAANDGRYSVRGLGAGSYRVTFNRVSGVAFSAPRIYDGVGEAQGAAGATQVTIANDGVLVQGINATLVEVVGSPAASSIRTVALPNDVRCKPSLAATAWSPAPTGRTRWAASSSEASPRATTDCASSTALPVPSSSQVWTVASYRRHRLTRPSSPWPSVNRPALRR